jgi:hypothetical protein
MLPCCLLTAPAAAAAACAATAVQVPGPSLWTTCLPMTPARAQAAHQPQQLTATVAPAAPTATSAPLASQLLWIPQACTLLRTMLYTHSRDRLASCRNWQRSKAQQPHPWLAHKSLDPLLLLQQLAQQQALQLLQTGAGQQRRWQWVGAVPAIAPHAAGAPASLLQGPAAATR